MVWGVVVHGAAAEIQQMSWCRVQSGAEVVQRWCRGFTFYQRCREVLQRCRGAGGRGAEVQRFGCGGCAGDCAGGAEVPLQRFGRGAEVVLGLAEVIKQVND